MGMDLSIFTVGKKLIEYCSKHAVKIVFSFSKMFWKIRCISWHPE